MSSHTRTPRLLIASAFILAVGMAPIASAETTGQYIDDATITAKVKAALIADQPLKALRVSVETDQGTVALSGSVDTKAQEAEAIKVANQVDGVKTVKDLLTVKTTQEE